MKYFTRSLYAGWLGFALSVNNIFLNQKEFYFIVIPTILLVFIFNEK
jgi:hypothetical protein